MTPLPVMVGGEGDLGPVGRVGSVVVEGGPVDENPLLSRLESRSTRRLVEPRCPRLTYETRRPVAGEARLAPPGGHGRDSVELRGWRRRRSRSGGRTAGWTRTPMARSVRAPVGIAEDRVASVTHEFGRRPAREVHDQQPAADLRGRRERRARRPSGEGIRLGLATGVAAKPGVVPPRPRRAPRAAGSRCGWR